MKKTITRSVALIFMLVSLIPSCFAAFHVKTSTISKSSIRTAFFPSIRAQATEAYGTYQPTLPAPSKELYVGSGKNRLVAGLLCYFLGAFGIHRFYLGYNWQGLVQLFTLGGFAIWVLVDFIRILCGTLGPKPKGRYPGQRLEWYD